MKRSFFYVCLFSFGILMSGAAQSGSAPPLPAGLDSPAKASSSDAPALPAGLGGETKSSPALPAGLESDQPGQPALPAGLSDPATGESKQPSEESTPFFSNQELLGFPLHGFAEFRTGMRTQDDSVISPDASIGETRLQLDSERSLGPFMFDWTSDFYYDTVLDEFEFDIRNANVTASPLDFMDVRLGRQILTWGTGDMLFINDLFPKDWQSFFIGRDEEYLKAPSDAVKVSFFSELANLDVVYTPQFDADTFIRGERISYWSDGLGRRAGNADQARVDQPNEWFNDDEVAVRLHRLISGYEAALYGYRGFWKSMGGMNPGNGLAIFPALSVYGASLRGTVGPGIGNLEAGYYHSEEDTRGDNPFIKNSEFRFLAGYEQEIGHDFTAGVQYYLEYMMDYSAYLQTLPAGMPTRDEARHLLTLRLTKLLLQQNLTLSFFTFYSPSDSDAYLRLKANYKVTDRLSTELGGNLFLGDEDYTFFGQFEDNSNVYAGIRYSF
jgi:hypothetical protein